jgi:hypothetical protein
LHTIGLVATYVTILIAVFAAGGTRLLLLAVLTLPLSIQSIRIFWNSYSDPVLVEKAVANFVTFRLHNLMGITLILVFCIHGVLQGRPVLPCAVILATLVITYAPVAMMLYNELPPASFGDKIKYLVGLKQNLPSFEMEEKIWIKTG